MITENSFNLWKCFSCDYDNDLFRLRQIKLKNNLTYHTLFTKSKWRMIIAVIFSNLSNWKEKPEKKSRLPGDSNPWPLRYRCDALPTELWSHTLRARSIYWVHISREKWNDVKYIWNNSYIWTAVVNWPLLTIESPVAQWLEHPTRSQRVVGSNPIWGSDFFRVLQTFNLSCVCCCPYTLRD